MNKPTLALVFVAQCIGALVAGFLSVMIANVVSASFGGTIERSAALVFFAMFGVYVFAAVHDWIAEAIRERRRAGYRWPA